MKEQTRKNDIKIIPGLEETIPADEAEEMGAFEEHALSEEDAKEAIDATEQNTKLISAINNTETKIKYLLSLEVKNQEKVNELLAIEFIKLTLSIGEEDVNSMYDLVNKKIEENSILNQEERDLTFAAVTGLSPDDAMRYMDMTLKDLEVVLETLYDELEV